MLDIAYELLNQKSLPSWLHAVTKGATTIWEKWDAITEDGTPTSSLNHYSPGAVINFLHRKVAGIEAAEPGYKRIRIHPQPGGRLTSAKAAYESVHGLIVSEWEQKDGQMRVNVTIPANTSAAVILPGAALDQVTENSHPRCFLSVPGSGLATGDQSKYNSDSEEVERHAIPIHPQSTTPGSNQRQSALPDLRAAMPAS